MAEADRTRWNQRYRQQAYDFAPPDWLIALGPQLRRRHADARALDLACGAGRNSLFLARLGYAVDAWDISDVGLELLRAELARASEPLPVAPRQVDLDSAALPTETYDLILDAHYLDRRLFPHMEGALKQGGLVLVHTFLQPPSGRYNPAHALEPGELGRAFASLIQLELSENVEADTAHLLAQRPYGSPESPELLTRSTVEHSA
jgi:tellurite methyltransferase